MRQMTDLNKVTGTGGGTESKVQSYTLKTIDEISQTMSLESETELTKQYNNKEKRRNDIVKNLVIYPDGLGEIFNQSIVSLDSGERYAIVVIDNCYDPDQKGGRNGCTYSADIQLFDLTNNSKILEIGPVTYRSAGNSPFNHSLNYNEAKILQETDEYIIFGIKSHDVLKIIKFDNISGKQSEIERIDLDKKRKTEIKIQNFEKAFNDLDTDAIGNFIHEPHYFTKKVKINDDYAIVMLYDPYGDTGSRHAKTKLIVKGKGIIDLANHKKAFRGSAVTQGFELEYPQLSIFGDKLIIEYTIKEDESIIHSLGSSQSYLGSTKHKIELDMTELNLPSSLDLKINGVIETQKDKRLSHGNLNPIPITPDGLGTYPYDIKKIIIGDRAYVSVVKMIDCERYYRGIIYHPQFNVSVYQVDNLSSDKLEIKEIFSQTSISGDYQKEMGVLYARKNGEIISFGETPQFDILDDKLKISYSLQGEKGKIPQEFFVNK